MPAGHGVPGRFRLPDARRGRDPVRQAEALAAPGSAYRSRGETCPPGTVSGPATAGCRRRP
ncbi:hypothetical protein GCM10010383_75280 [Streptomyces lomondensis]|uniref:Uncharacterized protein n=1 Tax=Streptomyces lomondensis TaxID=68229 RepID=A0ABQ2XW64_9ACTN|nr:hypothetical protein GCM10010383_75280 [Streptomyces lomondensis]